MKEQLFDIFVRYNPISQPIVSYREIDRDQLIVKFEDSTTLIFDASNKSFRFLPSNSQELTEDQCRREFGERLRKILFYKQLTQTDLSEMTGIPQCSISKYITGSATPSFYTVDRIAKALGCSADDLRYID